jgi:hypothetical protein
VLGGRLVVEGRGRHRLAGRSGAAALVTESARRNGRSPARGGTAKRTVDRPPLLLLHCARQLAARLMLPPRGNALSLMFSRLRKQPLPFDDGRPMS